MDFDATSTPAGLLAADGTSATTADEAPSYNPATTTPHSLMQELPPRPPSPYKTMQHNTHHAAAGKSSVTSSFLRGRRKPHTLTATTVVPAVGAAGSRAVNSATEDAPPSSQPPYALHRRIGDVPEDDQAALRNPNALVFLPTQRGDSAVVYVDAETHDSAMQHYLFYEAPRQRLVELEENERNALLAHEEVVYTSVTIAALQARAELLAGDAAAELVVAAALERAEARREMLQVIEVEVAARLREQRMGEKLEIQFRALLPAHEAGCRRIAEEEREDLRQLFVWHKEHRPLGPGCFIRGPEEDYRLKYASRGTSAATTSPSSRSLVALNGGRSGLSSAVSSREYAVQLRQKTSASATLTGALGELAVVPLSDGQTSATLSSTQDGTFGPGEEAVFVEEGRLRLQAQKSRRHDELRGQRRRTDLVEAQADARQYVLAEEALTWMHLTRAAVDGLYAAVEAARVREQADAAEAVAQAEREAQRAAVREQLLRERGITSETGSAEDTGKTSGELDGEGASSARALSEQVVGSPTESITPTRSSRGTRERSGGPLRRDSESTVADSTAATDASLDPLPDISDESGPETGNKEAPLAHLRLIAEETEESGMCRQLTTLTSSEVADEDCDEL